MTDSAHEPRVTGSHEIVRPPTGLPRGPATWAAVVLAILTLLGSMYGLRPPDNTDKLIELRAGQDESKRERAAIKETQQELKRVLERHVDGLEARLSALENWKNAQQRTNDATHRYQTDWSKWQQQVMRKLEGLERK